MKKHISCCHFFFFLFLFLYNNVIHAQDSGRISLDGRWRFALDIADEGIHKKWFLGTLPDQIDLPGTTDLAGNGNADASPWINYLQRRHKYIGAAWYQKDIDIPVGWNGCWTQLLLERVKWESRVWIDGRPVGGVNDGLVTAHYHVLGQLSPGRHTLTVRIDNRMIHPIGDKGHSYTEQTESIWNGIIGKIELQKILPAHVDRIRIFTPSDKKISVELRIVNPIKKTGKLTVDYNILDSKNAVIANGEHFIEIKNTEDTAVVTFPVKMNTALKPWSEFAQPLYTFQGKTTFDNLSEQTDKITFGYRKITANQYKILVNGIPAFIRGNQDAICFPLTGHVSMDVNEWRRIFKIYKSYGLNQVRFHSTCPPEEAFQAADEEGIYIMAELVWMTSINAKKDVRPISATMGIPQGLGNNDRTIDSFVVKETRRLLDQYGNHPSFCFFAFGNEMDNLNREKVNQWLGAIKKDDPRRLYAGTTARMVLPNDDFQDSHIVPKHKTIVNTFGRPSTMDNYDSSYVYTTVPVIAHELGQIPVFPEWKDTLQYTGALRFVNLEKSYVKAKENEVDTLDHAFKMASGHLQQILYKEEIEKQMRSRFAGGYNLLAMNDYTGQGEALVGWLDVFYHSKGITTPAEVKKYINTTVPLAEFSKRVFSAGDTLNVTAKLAHYGNAILKTGLHWQLTAADFPQKIIASGRFKAQKIVPGTVYDFGSLQYIFPDGQAKKYTLTLAADNAQYHNSWDFWVYPMPAAQTSEAYITSDVQASISAAKEGKKVLLLASGLGAPSLKNNSSFLPVFWSTIFFPNGGVQTLGALIDDHHPAFKQFPTGNALDWQWQDLCNHSHGFVLSGEGNGIRPIVEPIDDFHNNRKLGSLFEVRVGKGKILICGYDIENNLNSRPAAAQLRRSLLHYMSSTDFNPTVQVSKQWLSQLFQMHQTTGIVTNDAVKHWTVFPGYYSLRNTEKWRVGLDSIRHPSSMAKIQLLKGNIIYDSIAKRGFWSANKTKDISFDILVPSISIGHIDLNLINKNGKKINAVVNIEGRKTELGFPLEKKKISLQYFREDFDDNKLHVEINTLDDLQDIYIESITLIPEN